MAETCTRYLSKHVEEEADLGEKNEILVVPELVHGQHAGDFLLPRDRQHLSTQRKKKTTKSATLLFLQRVEIEFRV